MPSTHAAMMAYYAGYVSAACLYLPLHGSLDGGRASGTDSGTGTGTGSAAYFRALAPGVIVPWASMVAVSRVWLGYHSWAQVAVGSVYGAGFAALWLALWVRGGLGVLGNRAEETLVMFFFNGLA